MFKSIISRLSILNSTFHLIYVQLCNIEQRLKEVSSCHDYKYIVECHTSECITKSELLSSLKQVNEFISAFLVFGKPININIVKVYDDGR